MSQWDPDDDDLVDELPAPPRKSIPEADRELLHLAARAIGAVRVDDVEGEQWLSLHFADGTVTHGWNALLFYSDTFELSVALELDIMHRVVGGTRVEVLPPGGPLTQEFYAQDRLPATARAVVRAAAEIGKQRA
ncbi:MAG: hypothetical protein AB1807_11945 [Pseudomonadota bacterium]